MKKIPGDLPRDESVEMFATLAFAMYVFSLSVKSGSIVKFVNNNYLHFFGFPKPKKIDIY